MPNVTLWDALCGTNNCSHVFLPLPSPSLSKGLPEILQETFPMAQEPPPLDSHKVRALSSLLAWFTLVSPRCHYCPTDPLTFPTIKIQTTFSGKV